MATQLTVLELLELIMALGGSQQPLVQCHSGILQLHHKLSKRMHVFDVEEKFFFREPGERNPKYQHRSFVSATGYRDPEPSTASEVYTAQLSVIW